MGEVVIIEDILVQSRTDRRSYTADHIINVLEGGSSTSTITASYLTDSVGPAVYYTALNPDGSILTDRTTFGVQLSACGDYTYEQDVSTLESPREFVAVWDEGDVNTFVLERIVV